MKIEYLKSKKGFTLIEIIVVLIIVGILAAIALPAYFSWIGNSKTVEAILTLKTWKDSMEICLDVNIGNESICAQGGSKAVPIPAASRDFTYSLTGDASNTPPTGTGLSSDGSFALQATLNNGGDGLPTVINWTRNIDGSWSTACSGAFTSTCPSS